MFFQDEVEIVKEEPGIIVEETEEVKKRREHAKEKILFEAKRARERAEQMGPQGWYGIQRARECGKRGEHSLPFPHSLALQ